ncbi:prophage antirepressor [Neoasaia chiangmaiensis NBRC 101099]|uniref:Uncharacterized protein n=1 Tax=Neoasaia chiangmaiensis TaxID=320497 RepID=A0A1U9KQQ2_9PROT|nr:KilA-N domain-containing protein [Neoasaia chiangmaiensis]AQS88184.1 hypothetical protein A0U93_09790 [Neoasaia chiangmaiensis]GBR39913.1 prophage antirepressor [Neoasaia chiangmaiensis NBRC 101099]GEN14798.1 hypothetical protein NCH01_12290 [Neoasaia chiangmaiensis]
MTLTIKRASSPATQNGPSVVGNELTILSTSIRQDAEGRYSLNDCHRASGGDPNKAPSEWVKNAQTKALVAELSQSGNFPSEQFQPLKVINGGKTPGTFGHRLLVYAYGEWISASFHLAVLDAFDAMVTGKIMLPKSRSRRPSPLSAFKTGHGIALLMGMDTTQAGLYGARYCEKKCGENPLEIMGITYQPAVEQVTYLLATEVGERLSLGSGRSAAMAANKLIFHHGYQEKDDRGHWQPTKKGAPFAKLDETNRQHSAGTAQAWHWHPSLVDALRADMATEGSVVPFAKTPEAVS